MAELAELLVKLGVDSSELEEGTKSAVDSFESDMNSLGLAAGAGAVGLEAVAREAGATGVSVGNLANQLGAPEGAVRDMAKEMSNATFPMEDVLGLMETGAQRGLESEQALTQYATNWDMIGDATGESGPELAKAGVALEALGISAGQEGQALDAFGFIMNSTTQDVSEFLDFTERAGGDLQQLGLDVNDTAALFGILEQELGLTGRQARTELNEALSESDGTMSGLLDTLGLSEEQFASMRDEVTGSGDAIQENADNVADSMTPIQELQSMFEDLMVTLSPFSSQIAMGAVALGAVAAAAVAARTALAIYNGIMMAVRIATLIWTGVQWALNAALLANPITWIILLIIALIAIIILIILNWDKVKEKTLEVWDAIVAALSAAWEWIKTKASEIWNAIVSFFTGIWDKIQSMVQGAVKKVIMFFARLIARGKLEFEKLKLLPKIVKLHFLRLVAAARAQGQRLLSFVQSIPDKVKNFFSNAGSWLVNAGKNIIQGLINGVQNMIGSLRSKFSSVTSMIPDWKGPERVDLQLLEDSGGNIMSGLTEGIEDGLPGLRSTLQGVTDTIPDGVNASVSHRGMVSQEQKLIIDVTGADDDLVRVVQKWVRTEGDGDVQTLAGAGR